MVDRVLLVEDEPNIAEALSFILEREAMQVAHVASGAAAMAAVRAFRPDVVILDHMLPGMSGIEVLQALRQAEDTAAVPVLMLTAKGLPRDREAALKGGATAFMTKPFANAELVRMVRDLAQGTASLSGQGAADTGSVPGVAGMDEVADLSSASGRLGLGTL